MIVFPYILWLVAGEAWYEAIFDKGNKKKAKLIQSIWIATWFLLPIVFKAIDWKYVFVPLGYEILRVGIFDFVYASAYGLPFNYQSYSTYLWDKIINPVKRHKMLYTIYIILCFAVSFFLFNWMK